MDPGFGKGFEVLWCRMTLKLCGAYSSVFVYVAPLVMYDSG